MESPDPSSLSGAAGPYSSVGTAPHSDQVFRRDFPRIGRFYLATPLGNRQAQGDYGADQLQLRQSEIKGKRDANQIVAGISNQVIALRQARARYSAAANTRQLQDQLLEADQNDLHRAARPSPIWLPTSANLGQPLNCR